MVAVAVNPHPLHHFLNLAVHSHVKVAFAADRLEEFLVMSLSVLHLGRKQIDFVALVVLQQEIQDLLFGIFYHFLSRDVREGLARPCKEQTQEVINLRGGAHGASGVLVGGFLFNADYGAEAGNLVHIRTLQVAQEVAGIGAERLNVATLSLGIDGVKSQGRLSASAQSGYDGEAVAGNFHIDVLEVMNPGAQNNDLIAFTHLPRLLLRWPPCCSRSAR